MEILLTPSNIMFVLGVLGVIFAVFNYFKNPQIQIEKDLIKTKAQSDKEDNLNEVKYSYINESNNRRFNDIQKNFEALLLQSNNHIHTVDIKVETLSLNIISMEKELTRLSTIIEERIPKK